MLKISCGRCKTQMFLYQKDGPQGWLKRMYVDRIFDPKLYGRKNPPKEMVCSNCNQKLASLFIYEKEHRLSYKVDRSAIARKTLKDYKTLL